MPVSKRFGVTKIMLLTAYFLDTLRLIINRVVAKAPFSSFVLQRKPVLTDADIPLSKHENLVLSTVLIR